MFLTRLGLVAERVTRGFWPFWTVALVALAPFPFRLQDQVPPVAVTLWVALAGAAGLVALVLGLRRFRWPAAAEAEARVDAALPGRPIAAIRDGQAIGAEDSASRALWSAHLARMAAQSRAARPVAPDLRVASQDPFGLRLIAVLLVAVAVLFGPRGAAEGPVAPVVPGQVLASGPSWEGWIEPPAYTGKPSLYLADIPQGPVEVVIGSRVTIRLYGEAGANTVEESVSGGASPAEGGFVVAQGGRIAITGDDGAAWTVVPLPDAPPTVAFAGTLATDAIGEMAQPFVATDDFGVVSGTATIALDLPQVARSWGLATEPDPRDPLVLDLPMPFSGNRAEIAEQLIENLSEHPLANLPVTVTLAVRDAAGQETATEPLAMILPGRRFFQPVARAVIEQRRDLLWGRANAPRVLDLLRAIGNRPEDLFTSETIYLRLNFINRQLAAIVDRGAMTDAEQDEIATALWDLAIQLEDGTLADARERLQRAQERLSEAMRNGASPEEIAELMQELREATDDYLQMLAQNAEPGENPLDQPDSAQSDSQEVTQDQIQALMDRIQELMEEGRMAEAEQLMEQLNQLLQNLQVTQGQGGDGPRTPGQQSMEDLQDTLRDQQELSDEAFRDLQDQFNGRQPQTGQQQDGQQPGQQDGQEQGQQDGQQQGQQPGQQAQPGQEGQDGQPGQEGQNGQDDAGEQSLADRQETLRDELERQRAGLPGLTGEEADRAREALERAEGAMDRAEQALRDGQLAEAIDNQAEALNALREGLRDLGQALARNQQDDAPGENGEGAQTADRVEPARRDPLGRQLGNAGQFGSDQSMLQGEDVYRRAEELLQELRRRAGELGRDDAERDYLRRLLERF